MACKLPALISFVKLAELYTLKKDSLKSDLYWKRAKAWDSKGIIDPEIFSPQSILRFRSIKYSGIAGVIKIKAPSLAQIFWNGKKLPTFEKVLTFRANPGKHQLAVLIPGSPWDIRNFGVAENLKTPLVFEFKSNSMLSGDCSLPIFSGFKVPEKGRVIGYYEKQNCIRTFDGQAWFDLKGKPLATESSGNVALDRVMGEESLTEKKSWLARTTSSSWFWVGLGALVAGTAVFVKSQEPVLEPTHTHH